MFRDVINYELKKRNISRKDFAETVDITKSRLSNYLNGKADIGSEKVESMLIELSICLTIPNEYEINFNNTINGNYDWTNRK